MPHEATTYDENGRALLDRLDEVKRVISEAEDANGFRYNVEWTPAYRVSSGEWETSAISDFGALSDGVLRILRGCISDSTDLIFCASPVYRAYVTACCKPRNRCHPHAIVELSKHLGQDQRWIASGGTTEEKLERLMKVHAQLRNSRHDRVIKKMVTDEKDVAWSSLPKADVLDAYRRSRLQETCVSRVKDDVGVQLVENVHVIDIGELFSTLESLGYVGRIPVEHCVTVDVHERWIRIEFRVRAKRAREGDLTETDKARKVCVT
ncbi:hypothetical protein CYMTET_3873 [Cymbomonas tetramitiformis]|uniref:Uncharacterized protein n=1 Tax=Cymbomonas tetramitiformis TaxID=36881 RepID=A0AAE0H2B4_9CHLO|nr:hypothetical protein CYMTET_3873 [Cymbomonas tetramitiformis]